MKDAERKRKRRREEEGEGRKEVDVIWLFVCVGGVYLCSVWWARWQAESPRRMSHRWTRRRPQRTRPSA